MSGFQSFWVNGLLWKPAVSGSLILGKTCFNPSGSMDYFGRQVGFESRRGSQTKFQSFWVNGLLWKSQNYRGVRREIEVSILLGQWITLEDVRGQRISRNRKNSFNPSGSMDYFGRVHTSFQPLLSARVSILLGQWITLEVPDRFTVTLKRACFNPSGSMDYFGRMLRGNRRMIALPFQSFWVNGLLWKSSINAKKVAETN